MVLTPGPNMIYLVSRILAQGRKAGLISLCGVAFGFVVYMVCAACGVTVLLIAVPYAYDALRLAGAAYLLWLAWQCVRPGASAPFDARDLPHEGPHRLFAMGFLTNLLNPKIAVMYLSLLPQFVSPEQGGLLAQSLALGATQIAISVTVNALHSDGRIDRHAPDTAAELGRATALADGNGAGRTRRADGNRGATVTLHADFAGRWRTGGVPPRDPTGQLSSVAADAASDCSGLFLPLGPSVGHGLAQRHAELEIRVGLTGPARAQSRTQAETRAGAVIIAS